MMHTVARPYVHASDYERVDQFLVRTYSTSRGHVNWLPPRWEYMHHTSGIVNVDVSAIGVWESHGKIVGVIHPEHQVGTVYVEVDPEYASLKREMLVYVQEHLYDVTGDRARRLRVYINDWDREFHILATEMGYRKSERSEPMSHFPITDPFPATSLPDGFRLRTIADGYDLRQLTVAIWRGFDHVVDPSADNTEWRKRMEAAPNYRPDLHIMVEAPDRNVASYCGMWYQCVNRIAYVEPVATVPEYRRMGLGTAAVREGVRRCGEQGATVAYVGSATPFYLAVGFTQICNRSLWTREWT